LFDLDEREKSVRDDDSLIPEWTESAESAQSIGQLEYLTEPSPEGAFRTALNDVHEFAQDLDTRLDAHLGRLRERLKALAPSEKDGKRITELLDAGDTVTAEECLALLEGLRVAGIVRRRPPYFSLVRIGAVRTAPGSKSTPPSIGSAATALILAITSASSPVKYRPSRSMSRVARRAPN
jgi:hypothetical protein